MVQNAVFGEHRFQLDVCPWKQFQVQTVQLWQIDIDRNVRRMDEMALLLSPEELARAASFRFPRDRQRFVVRRGVLRTLLSRYLDLDPREVIIERNEFGRPYVSSTYASDIDFNLAHSEGLSLLAFSRGGQIGIDLESIRPLEDLELLVSHSLCDVERAEFDSSSASSKLERFYQYWTSKEAYLKLLGTGLTTPPDLIEIRFENSEPLCQATVMMGGESIPGISLWSFTPAPGTGGFRRFPQNSEQFSRNS